MKRFAFIVALCGALSVKAADISFSYAAANGDLAAPANWAGGILPGEDDTAVLNANAGVSRSEFFLSDNQTYGGLSMTGFMTPVSLDLHKKRLSAGSVIAYGRGPYSITNGTLASSGKFTVDYQSAVAIGPEATVTMPDSINGNGIVLNQDARLTIDGGVFNVPSIAGGWSLGNQFGTWNKVNAMLEVKNGGVFRSPKAGRNQVTLFHSKILMSDSTFDISNGNNTDYSFMTGNSQCQIAVTNSTFNFNIWQVGGSSQCGLGCSNGSFTFVDSTVGGTVSGGIASSDMTFYHASGTPSVNNVFRFVDSDTFVNFKFGGITNRVNIVGGTKSGLVILNGVANGLYVTNGAVNATEDRFQIKGTDSIAEFSGERATLSKINGNNKIKFASGSNLSLRFRDGAKAYIGYYGDAEMMSIADDVNGMLIVVDNASLTTEGYLDMTAKGATNVVFELRGTSPTWRVGFWQTCRRALLTLGRKDTLLAEEAPRIRFVLPETPYATAPIYTQDSPWFSVVLTSTARLEFDFSECGRANMKRVYPLIKGASMSHAGNGQLTPINEERLAELTANANLPDGCSLQYDSSTCTLSLVKEGDGGFAVIIR